MTNHTGVLLVKALRVALLEFERISFQKKADEGVIKVLQLAVKRGESEINPEYFKDHHREDWLDPERDTQ